MALSVITQWAARAGLGTLLAGCCANNVCDCPNETQADAIRIAFDRAKFSTADLDTLVLVRYLHYDVKNPPAVLPKPETVTLVRTAAQLAANDTVVINTAAPFSPLGSARLDTFSYALRYYPGTSPKTRASKRVLFINRVKLSGSFEGNGCCTCYTNSRKRAQVWPDSIETTTFIDLKARKAVLQASK